LCSNISHLCRAIPVEISADCVRRHRLRSWYPVPAARTNRMTPPVAALHRRLHPRMDGNRERRTARGLGSKLIISARRVAAKITRGAGEGRRAYGEYGRALRRTRQRFSCNPKGRGRANNEF
jgi:hypothetical protein